MTEADWLACRDPVRLLKRSPRHLRARKMRLVGVGCCRAVPGGFADDTVTRAVELAERFADGQATDADLIGAHAEILTRLTGPDVSRLTKAERSAARHLKAWVAASGITNTEDEWSNGGSVRAGVILAIQQLPHCYPYPIIVPDVHAAQAALVRDIAGNPFRPAAFAPEWRTADAVGVADAIYAGRAFHDLPILADALQDAGCDSADLLDHLRHPGPHARGCWALDLVLGRG